MADVATQKASSLSGKGRFGAKKNSSPRNLKEQTPEAQDVGADELESQIEQSEDGQTDAFEEIANDANGRANTNGDEVEEGSAILAGSVDQDGNVIDEEGKIIGKVNGQSVPEGSIVDQEGDVLDNEGNVIGKADIVGETAEQVERASETAEKPELKGPFGVQDNGEITNAAGVPIGKLAVGDPKDLVGQSIKEIDESGNLKAESGSTIGKADLKTEILEKAPDATTVPASEKVADAAATDASEKAPGEESLQDVEPEAIPDLSILEGKKVNKLGKIVDDKGTPIGQLVEGVAKKLVGRKVDADGKIWDDAGKILGRAELLPETEREEDVESAPFEDFPDSIVDSKGNIVFEGRIVGKILEGDAKKLEGKKVDADGDILDKHGNVLGKAERFQEEEPVPEEPEEPEAIDLSLLEGKKVNKAGNVVDENGKIFGRIINGDVAKLAGMKCDAEGKFWSNGKVIGNAELVEASERDVSPDAPFEDFPGAVVDSKGNIVFEGRVIGKILEGDAKKLEGKKVDADGDILDKHGNVLGKAERFQEEDPEESEAIDLSLLEGKKVNKAGNVVDENGKLFGRVINGDVAKLIGMKCDAEGKFWRNGKVVGNAELVEAGERDISPDAPFEDFPDAIVDTKGYVVFEGQAVGKLIEGDAKKLAGKKVDKDGEVVDKVGNVIGKAERWWEEDAPEPEAVDMSALSGKRVNKLGNVVDTNGSIFGRLVEGDPKKLAGRMCDKNGNVRSEAGDILGRAELVPDSERQGEKTGPFADIQSPTVIKDGKVSDANGSIIGRVVQGDAKLLFGKPVDDDGDILDRNGNTLGKAERWEEEEKEVSKYPAAGRRVNREGNVMDENGDVIAKLTEGEITKCAGKEIDNDGDVVDGKGKAIGHVTLLEDIPAPPPVEEPVEEEPEPEESEEEIEARKQLEMDKKLAGQMANCISQSIDKIKPILKMITDTIDAALKEPKEELDEQKLVDTVKPLIEEGGMILQEANGVIRGLDPDGRIQTNAKHKTAAREATPEEYRLADVLKELTGSVTQTIDQAKKKIAGMPHAKKELNPLWGLLAEPLGQILAAVGLLLSGVLGLVGKLLSGLGLGGLLDNLLGSLGIKGILKGLGLGMITESLTGKK